MSLVPPPPTGLGSNSNYFVSSSGIPMTDLNVTVKITQDLDAAIGLGIQLNAYAPNSKDPNTTWMQFCWGFDPRGAAPYIMCSVEYFWGNESKFNDNQLAGGHYVMPQSESPQTIPAGYAFNTILQQDNSGNITGATFNLSYNDQVVQTWTASIPPYGQPSAVLASIYAFQLNIVAQNSSVCTFLGGGAGNIIISAGVPLTVLSGPPNDLATPEEFTAEESNSAYAELQAGPYDPNFAIQQEFWANLTTLVYRPGGHLAVSQQIGLGNQTSVFAVDQQGQLAVFSVQGGGHWENTTFLGSLCMAHPEAKPAAALQIGAPNQTDVFVVDQSGQLNVFWTQNTGGWHGPVPIGPGGTLGSHACLAASQQFGAYEQTDVFVVDKNGRLNVYYVQGTGPWSTQPVYVGVLTPSTNSDGTPTTKGSYPSGAPLAVSEQFGAGGQTDVFVVDNNGLLNVVYVQGGSPWVSQPVLLNQNTNISYPKGAYVAASQRFGVPNQTDVYAVDKNGVLHVYSVLGTGNWSDSVPISSSGPELHPGAPVAVSQHIGGPNQTDVFVADKTGQLWVVSFDQGTGKWSTPSTIGPAGLGPATDQSPGGNGAYLLASPQYGLSNQTDLFVINQTGTNSPGWPMVLWADYPAGWNGPKALVTEV